MLRPNSGNSVFRLPSPCSAHPFIIHNSLSGCSSQRTIMPTIAQILQTAPIPRNETRLLLQHITGYTATQIITRDHETLPENQSAQLQDLIARRNAGEPIAYLIGTREFYGRTFAVSPAVLIPRPETEHLLEAALFRLPENGTLWDLGTGSGIIAISAKCERPDATVFASDISANALAIAQQNAATLHAAVSFAQGAWFAANHVFRLPENSVHVIVSNPPYIEANDPHLQQGDLRFEPPHALTDFADGLAHIRQITHDARQYLADNGWLLFEHGYNQGQAVREILHQLGYTQIETQQDLAGLDRVTLGCFCPTRFQAA